MTPRFWCWLFGHNIFYDIYEKKTGSYKGRGKYDYCQRCGEKESTV